MERPLSSDSTSPDPRLSESRGDATREALVQAGLELFAKLGYHAASSRALADAASVNQALIGYHFGGKHGLYLAVFDHIGHGIAARLGPAAAQIQQRLAEAADGEVDRETLLAGLLALIDQAVDLFTAPETEAWAMLIVREQQNPSDAFDLVWNRVMSRFAGVLSRLVGALRNESDEAPQVRLTVLTIISQPLFFRVARETALRVLGWQEIGAAEIEAIKERIHHNVLAMLAQESPS